jgi:elongation of very long chain fatty acids protein 6
MSSTQNIADFVWPYIDPPIHEAFWFENFDVVKCRDWMEKNWSISLYICAVYILLIFLGQNWMKDRKAYDLKRPLALWNLFMALFSVFGFLRCMPELLHVLNGNNGFHRSICVR